MNRYNGGIDKPFGWEFWRDLFSSLRQWWKARQEIKAAEREQKRD